MLVIIGPSASGKTQIVNSLIQFYKMKKSPCFHHKTRPLLTDILNFHLF